MFLVFMNSVISELVAQEPRPNRRKEFTKVIGVDN